jgi:O-antigen/teichoic acid export membrane protein
VTPRAPDPAPAPTPAAGGQAPAVTASLVNGLPPTSRRPLLDRRGPTGIEPGPATTPGLTAASSYAAVGVPAPSFGGDRHDRQQQSPFSLRKVVVATPPADPVAPTHNVRAEPPTPSSAQIAPPLSDAGAEVDTGSPTADKDASLDEPRAAVNSGLRWTMMRTILVEGVNLLGVVVLARLVDPAEFGRYAIALIVLLLATVPTWAVQYTIVQRDQIDRDHLKTGQTLSIVMGLAVCAFCLAASYTLVPALFGERTAVLVRLMIPACLINSVNTVQCAIVARRLEFRRSSLIDMTTSLVGAIVAIPLAVIGLNGAAIVLGVDAGSLAGFILICFWVRPPIPNYRGRAARDFARSGIPAASNAASLVCFENCDYVIVGARVGALQAGYYFRAYALGVVYQTKVSQVLTTVGIPVLSRVQSEDEVHRLRRRMIQTITMILFPLLTALAIVAPKFVTWLYGPAWQTSVVPVQILTIGGAAMLVAQAVTVAMLSSGRARAVMLWGWGHFFAYAAAVFAVAHLGLPAVALAAVTVHTTFLLIIYLQLHHGSVRQASKAIAKDLLPAAASSVCLAALALPVSMLASTLGIPILPYLLLIALAGGTGYFLSLRLWFPTELRDLGLFVGRLLPARVHRMFGGLTMRPQTQSAA